MPGRACASVRAGREPSRHLLVPASFFGTVLGLAGLGAAWRAAQRVWQLPEEPGAGLLLPAALVWAISMVLCLPTWPMVREAALAALAHPVQCRFVGLIGSATMPIAGGVLPCARSAAMILFVAGAVFTLLFAVRRSGGLWPGERDRAATTAVLHLPAVAAELRPGHDRRSARPSRLGRLAFGAGLFAWLAIEPVLLHRLPTGPALDLPLRPTLGIQLAPPVMGAVACLAVSTGPPDLLAHALLGYGLLQAAILLRLLPWIRQQPFGPSYRAYAFGATALATVPLRMVEQGESGAVAMLAPCRFLAANAAVAIIAVATIGLAFQGRSLPTIPAPAAARDRAGGLPTAPD